MINSRAIDDLRADVAANCRCLIALCAAEGLPVLVTNTVRDEAYQNYLYQQGRTRPGSIVTNSPIPTFHSVEAGLAFDVCKNVKGQEYSDAAFFQRVGAIGKELGFTWGGDWRSFPDQPHFQWDANGAYTGAMIRAGQLPPAMPLYAGAQTTGGEEEDVTQQQFDAMLENYLERLAQREPGEWSAEARQWAEESGILYGDTQGRKQYKNFCTREQVAVFLHRLAQKLGQ